MTTDKLSNYQVDRLVDSIVQHMYADESFMREVAREHVHKWAPDDYYEWFQEESEEPKPAGMREKERVP